MKETSGLELLVDDEGEGRAAIAGDTLVFNMRVFLNRGDEVPLNEQQATQLPASMLRTVDGRAVVDHTLVLGTRRAIAGVEYALYGMRVGGHRRVRISPHLAYRETGVPGLIPENAVLEVELWLRELR